MKPTQLTELLANIKNTFVSFFSILMFVALGVGIFLGISWVEPALQNAAGGMYAQGSFHDVQVQFPYGLTDDDLAKLGDLEGVTEVEPARQSFQELPAGDRKLVVKVQSMGQRIDVLSPVEGELPAREGEIALNAIAAGRNGIAVGDSLTFISDASQGAADEALDDGSGSEAGGDADGMKYLVGATYKVTALVNSPEYLGVSPATYGSSSSSSGSVDLLAWVPASSFDASAFQGGYPVVNVRCAGLADMAAFSDEYSAASKEVESRVAALGDVLANARYDDLHGQAQQKVDDAEVQLEEGKAKIADGERQLEEGRAQLEEKRAEGESKLEEAYQTLVSLQARYEEGLAEYEEMQELYDEAVSTVEDLTSEVDGYAARKAELDADLESGAITQGQYDEALAALVAEANAAIEPGRQYLDGAYAVTSENFDETLDAVSAALGRYRDIPIPFDGGTITLDEAQDRLDEARDELDDGYAKLQEGWAQYYGGQAELEELVAEGEQQLADGEAQVEQAKEQVAETEPKLEQAKEQVASMKDYDWTVLPRSYNASAMQVSMFGDITTNLSFSMAALFVIVGLLVSYSAVSRIVHEQLTQIGTKKALGLRGREITLSFLAYSGLAVILGAVIGTAVGVTLVEGIIGHVLGKMFVFGDYPPYFGLGLFLVVTALELVLVLGATWLACRSVLRENAIELLKGEKPPAGKARFYERWGIWERLPLFTQTIVNNCVNDKRRVFSTIVGVAGCTALIVTAITLNDDVLESYDRQYEDVYGFNAVVYVDTSVEGAAGNVEQALRGQGAQAVQVLRKNLVMTKADGERGTVRVIVPADGEAFARVYHVNPTSGGSFDLGDDGVWMSRAYADHFGAKAGDSVRVMGADGVEHSLSILGFYEFWLTNQEMVMGVGYYEREFDAQLVPNAVLADTGTAAVADAGSALKGVEGFSSIADDKASQGDAFSQFSSISRSVVAIYMALSVLMAIVVLLNLNVMFIEEKKRELIVLMINGFSTGAAKRYIYNDTIVLTAVGIVLGVAFGCVMGSVTVGAIELSSATFVKDVDWTAVGVGVTGSAVLALVMSLVSLRRIPRFDLTDINRF